MDDKQARARLTAERREVQALLADATTAGRHDREAQDETGDVSDFAQPLTQEGVDDAVAVTLRDRLDAIDRALKRLDDGTYGRSVRSGRAISPERLDADPAAELTVEEARSRG